MSSGAYMNTLPLVRSTERAFFQIGIVRVPHSIVIEEQRHGFTILQLPNYL